MTKAGTHFSFLPLGDYPAGALRYGFGVEDLSSAPERRTSPSSLTGWLADLL
jgi:hypothetical protein